MQEATKLQAKLRRLDLLEIDRNGRRKRRVAYYDGQFHTLNEALKQHKPLTSCKEGRKEERKGGMEEECREGGREGGREEGRKEGRKEEM